MLESLLSILDIHGETLISILFQIVGLFSVGSVFIARFSTRWKVVRIAAKIFNLIALNLESNRPDAAKAAPRS